MVQTTCGRLSVVKCLRIVQILVSVVATRGFLIDHPGRLLVLSIASMRVNNVRWGRRLLKSHVAVLKDLQVGSPRILLFFVIDDLVLIRNIAFHGLSPIIDLHVVPAVVCCSVLPIVVASFSDALVDHARDNMVEVSLDLVIARLLILRHLLLLLLLFLCWVSSILPASFVAIDVLVRQGCPLVVFLRDVDHLEVIIGLDRCDLTLMLDRRH